MKNRVIKRREFLKVSAAGAAAAAAVASPAIAQSAPEVKWRLTSSFPPSLDTIYGGATHMAKQVADMTDNKFQIQVFAPGEVAPALEALPATSDGKVEMCHTVSYYYVGKDPTFAVFSAVPFGLNARMQNSWLQQGGGGEIAEAFFKKHNVVGIPCGNTGTQMGGWFRKEIKTPADLQGLKFRIGGIAGQVLAKLGVVPQQLGGGDIYPALEKGTIDAAEWVGPYDDEKLGFNKVAPYYYYPGWWEGGPTVHAFVNQAEYNKLPKNYQAILQNACANTNSWMGARYDMQNPQALRKLIAANTKLMPFSKEVMEACLKATNELWAEISAKNADFKTAIDAMQAYRGDQYLWWQIAEYNFDTFMIGSRGRG
jgi:TRAP-type mannitol/chloroaromatic compound transport system substrate-binding protein